jgi:hypothetical protein
MTTTDRRYVLKDSLLAMKRSLLTSYEMKTYVEEEGRLLLFLGKSKPDYVVFSDYRRNEGRRRIQDAIEIIDDTVEKIDTSDYPTCSVMYLNTLQAVAKLTKLARVLESFGTRNSVNKEKEEEGIAALSAL